jgi:hypothetical protein
VKYTQAELYYYFKKELSKKYNIFMGFCYNIAKDNMCFIAEDSKFGLTISEELCNFKFENIEIFLETHKESYDLKKLLELEKDSYELIQKLKILEEECIPRVLIERNFKSKLKSL